MRQEPTANEGACDSYEEVGTIPNPVPCTILPASHPAMMPTTNIRFLQGGGESPSCASKASCQDGDCAKLLTSRGLRIYPHADASAPHWDSAGYSHTVDVGGSAAIKIARAWFNAGNASPEGVSVSTRPRAPFVPCCYWGNQRKASENKLTYLE